LKEIKEGGERRGKGKKGEGKGGKKKK